jgi:hypothetical protein
MLFHVIPCYSSFIAPFCSSSIKHDEKFVQYQKHSDIVKNTFFGHTKVPHPLGPSKLLTQLDMQLPTFIPCYSLLFPVIPMVEYHGNNRE